MGVPLSAFISRTTAARVVVLALVAVLALGWAHLVAPSQKATPTVAAHRATRPAVADPPVAQADLAGPTVAEVTTPLPTPVPAAVPATSRPTAKHHARKAGKGRHHRHHRAARRAHHRPDPWRSKGGRDIGWPQCPRDVGSRGGNGLGQPLPDPGVEFVIVGLTNGRAFTPNPCLDLHLGWVRSHHVQAAAYAFAAFPSRAQMRRFRYHGPYDGHTRLGALANAGRATAAFNINLMRLHGFVTPHVWLDLEPSSTNPWSGRRSWNRAVVHGWLRGYRDAGYTVGFYSTTSMFRDIVGNMRLRLPEWRTAGPVSPRAALRQCRSQSIQGGPAVLAQWWTTHRDFDRICPSPDQAATMAQYFHQW